MYELLLRTETLLLNVKPLILLGIGVGSLLAGLILWLAGIRYSAIIIGLLGALVGAICGLFIGQWLTLHLLLSTIVGAIVLAATAILLRNALIVALAVAVVVLGIAGGYAAVLLDRAAPEQGVETVEANEPAMLRSFQDMDTSTRLSYVDAISNSEQAFSHRSGALAADTWEGLGPHFWKLVLSVLVGAIVAGVIVWFFKRVLVALACSLVGTATLLLGTQMLLLAADFQLASALQNRGAVVPITVVSMVVFGWIVQMVISRTPKSPGGASPEPEGA